MDIAFPNHSAKNESQIVDHKKLIDLHQDLIAEHLDPSQVIPYLSPYLTESQIQELTVSDCSTTRQASKKLLSFLKDGDEPGWSRAFMDSLNQEGYKILGKLLNGEIDIIHQEIYKALLKVFYQNFVKDVEPEDLLPYLLQCQCISDSDHEDLHHAIQRNPRRKACLILLTRIAAKDDKWFPHFMFALVKTGYSHIVRNVDPLFEGSETLEQAENVGIKFIREHLESADKQNLYVVEPGMSAEGEVDEVDKFDEVDGANQQNQSYYATAIQPPNAWTPWCPVCSQKHYAASFEATPSSAAFIRCESCPADLAIEGRAKDEIYACPYNRNANAQQPEYSVVKSNKGSHTLGCNKENKNSHGQQKHVSLPIIEDSAIALPVLPKRCPKPKRPLRPPPQTPPEDIVYLSPLDIRLQDQNKVTNRKQSTPGLTPVQNTPDPYPAPGLGDSFDETQLESITFTEEEINAANQLGIG